MAAADVATAHGSARRLVMVADRSAILRWIERKIGLTPTGLLLVVLAVVGWALARLLGSQTMYLLSYGVVSGVVLAWSLGRRKLGIHAERSTLPVRVREGQPVTAEFTLTANRRVSTVVVEEALHDQLGTSVRVPVPLLTSGNEVTHEYTFSPRLRGVYKVGPLVAEANDPAGLTKRRETLIEPVEIIVHPSTEMVHDRVTQREWEDPPVRPPVSKPWPTGFEFYGMRDYVIGDDPRRIIWRKTAQYLDENGQGRYLVQESEQGITDHVQLFLDSGAAVHSPGRPSETFELAVRAVASLGVRHLRDGFSVTLHSNEERLARALRGRTNEIPFLDSLARLDVSSEPFTTALERHLVGRRTNAHTVIVTPHLDRTTASRLRLLMNRGEVIVLVHLMWDGTEPISLHRAGSLGCSVVELTPNTALERIFRSAVRAGRS